MVEKKLLSNETYIIKEEMLFNEAWIMYKRKALPNKIWAIKKEVLSNKI